MGDAWLSAGILLLIGISFLAGTIGISGEIPATQAFNQRQDALIRDLIRMRATHIYTDYWTCDRIAFASDEHIICGVLDSDLQGTHNNRYTPYLALVRADPRAAYVFLMGSPQAATMARQAASSGVHYQRFYFDGYIVYQPVSADVGEGARFHHQSGVWGTKSRALKSNVACVLLVIIIMS